MSVMKRPSQLQMGDRVLIGDVYWEVRGTSFAPDSEWELHLWRPGGRLKSVRCDAGVGFIVAEPEEDHL